MFEYFERNAIWIFYRFPIGLPIRKITILQLTTRNREIQTNRDLTGEYHNKIDFLPKPWNDPMVISRILYDEDGMQAILKSWLFKSSFSRNHSKSVQHLQQMRFPKWKSLPDRSRITPRPFPNIVLFIAICFQSFCTGMCLQIWTWFKILWTFPYFPFKGWPPEPPHFTYTTVEA